MNASRPITSFREFWPYYVREHRSPGSRALHFLGTTLAMVCLVTFAVTGQWWLLLAAPLVGYSASWLGHIVIERNRPATFRYPVWSLMADGRMWLLMLTGRMEREIAALDSRSDAQ